MRAQVSGDWGRLLWRRVHCYYKLEIILHIILI